MRKFNQKKRLNWWKLKKYDDGIRIKILKCVCPPQYKVPILRNKFGYNTGYTFLGVRKVVKLPYVCNTQERIAHFIYRQVGSGIWGVCGVGRRITTGLGGFLFLVQIKKFEHGLGFFVQVDRITNSRLFLKANDKTK